MRRVKTFRFIPCDICDMYGAKLDFSGVTLPGVGGHINSSNAISADQLASMNKRGTKWRVDDNGNLVHYQEELLNRNRLSREKRFNLVNRNRNESEESIVAMQEIFGRKKARAASFQQLKAQEYNFGEKTCKKCGPQCDCDSCKKKFEELEEEQKYREWTTAAREKLASGEIRGRMAGPNNSFPIASEQDVSAAWSSVGRAANPRKVMANIIKIAQEFGWEAGLPVSVRERMKAGESGLPS